jgi:hypothetical protein
LSVSCIACSMQYTAAAGRANAVSTRSTSATWHGMFQMSVAHKSVLRRPLPAAETTACCQQRSVLHSTPRHPTLCLNRCILQRQQSAAHHKCVCVAQLLSTGCMTHATVMRRLHDLRQ